MKKAVPGLILAVWLVAGFALAGQALAREAPLMTPGVKVVLDRAHLYKSEDKDELWVHYNLVVRDGDLLDLDREEAAALLLAAFKAAPDREKYESAWLNLQCVSGGESVFGKIHGRAKGEPPVTDLSMFEVNRSLLEASLNLKHGLVKELDDILSRMLDLFKEKLGQGPGPRGERPDGEMEL